MLHEYAVDPKALSASWEQFRYLYDGFGCDKGRVISRFPRRWARHVYEACSHLSTVQRKRVEESLRSWKDRTVTSARHYNSGRPWLANALDEQQTAPFHAIIAPHPEQTAANVLAVEELTGEHPLWVSTSGEWVERSALALARTVEPLLSFSEEILFVDPNFTPTREKWLRPLREFLACKTRGRVPLRRCEYHIRQRPESLSTDAFADACLSRLPDVVPAGMEVHLLRWTTDDTNLAFHARYILTERGGVGVEYGLDEGPAGSFTDMQLLPASLWRVHWDAFQVRSCPFTLHDEIVVRGRRRAVD